MDLLQLMQNRRSVRKFTGEAVSEEQLKTILQAALLSPTSRGKRSWEFVVVQDAETLEKLSKCRVMGSSFLKGADKAIVVIGDTSATDVWVEDCSIAMANMYLMADAIGVGSCWIQGRNRKADQEMTTETYVKNLLNIPEKYALEAIMALGIPAEHAAAYELDKLSYEKVHYDRF